MSERPDRDSPRTDVTAANRRAVLASGAGVLLTGLAGCSTSGGDGTPEPAGNGAENATSGETATATSSVEPTFEHPETVPFDESFSLTIGDLPAGAVDVSASLADHRDVEWSTRGTYETDDGRLVLDETAPTDREFGAGTMNLVNRATPASGSSAYYPYIGSPVTTTFRVERDGVTLGSTTVERAFGGDAVKGREIDSDGFVGTVYGPPGDGPAPGVVVLHGSEGVPADSTAAMLATHGYVTVALHYFEYEDEHELLPNELVEVPLEFVERAASWLLDDERTSGSTVGLWGLSKGGELGLLAGSRLDDVGPVVSVSGSGYVWGGVARSGGPSSSSWSHDGEPVPYVPYVDDKDAWDTEVPYESRPGYTASFERADEDRLDDARIAAEGIDGPVLLVSGAKDSLWNAVGFQQPLADRLENTDTDVDHRVYDEAGHAIKYPYRPATNRVEGNGYVYGGSTAGYAEADADHWPRVIDAFASMKQP